MILYGVLIVAYGIYHAKRKNAQEYFLAGRDMIWPIVGISLFAANISSSTLVGLAGAAFKTDTHVFNYEWLASVVLVFFAIFFLPFYLRSKVYTMPEFLERRFNASSRYFFSALTIIGNVLIDTAASLYIGSIVMQLIFPDISPSIIIIILALAAAAYTIPGGLNSVIQTEVIQAILLVCGSILLTYFAFDKVGGWSGMIAGLDQMGAAGKLTTPGTDIQLKNADEVLSMVRSTGDGWKNFIMGTGGDTFMPWTGLVFGAPILGFYFWANNQFMVQRVLGAKSIDHGRWGALFAGLLKLPVLFFMVLPGTVAILLYSGMDISAINYKLPDGSICQNLGQCSDATYPVLLFDLLPTGILGLVLAGLLAAMMSSISATFNSASTLITMDFVNKMKPDMSSKDLVRAGQIATIILVVLASIWATQIGKFGGVFEYLQKILSFICPPVAAAFVVGMFWKRANGTGALTSLVFGFCSAILLLMASIFKANGSTAGWVELFTTIHFLHMAFFLFVACALILIIVSLMTAPPPQEKLDGFTYNKGIFNAETVELEGVVWYKNYRYQSIALLIITAILVGFFW